MAEFFESVLDVVEGFFFCAFRALCAVICAGCICSAAYHILNAVFLAEGPGDFVNHVFMGGLNIAFVRYFFFSKN